MQPRSARWPRRWPKRRPPGPPPPPPCNRPRHRQIPENPMFNNQDLTTLIFGRLTWEAFPYHEPILVATFIAVALGGLALMGAMTYFKVWGTLWRDWITSIDHKKIGIMYMVLGIVM